MGTWPSRRLERITGDPEAVQGDRTRAVYSALCERNKSRNKRLFAHFGTTDPEPVAATRFILRRVKRLGAGHFCAAKVLFAAARPAVLQVPGLRDRQRGISALFVLQSVRPCDCASPLFRMLASRGRVFCGCSRRFPGFQVVVTRPLQSDRTSSAKSVPFAATHKG